MAKTVILPIDDDGTDPGDALAERTIGDVLARIAVEHCQQRNPSSRDGHVRAMFLFLMNEDRTLGRAVTAAGAGHPNYDEPGSLDPPGDLTDWQRTYYSWARSFYPRMIWARGLRMSPDQVRTRTLAFSSALASLMRAFEWRCLSAGQNERPPFLDGYGIKDPLLSEPQSGRRKSDVQ